MQADTTANYFDLYVSRDTTNYRYQLEAIASEYAGGIEKTRRLRKAKAAPKPVDFAWLKKRKKLLLKAKRK